MGKQEQINDQQILKTDVISAKGAILMELPRIGKEYGGRENIPDSVLKEYVLLILKKSPMIAVAEIREAYRLWSIEEIVVKGGEVYGGQFNAGQLGKVLGAYCQNRKKYRAPVFWYQAALDRDMISFELGEAQSIYQEALQISKLEVEQEEVGDGPKRLGHTLQKNRPPGGIGKPGESDRKEAYCV